MAHAAGAPTSDLDEIVVIFNFPDGHQAPTGFRVSQGGFDIYAKAFELGGRQEPGAMTLYGPCGSPTPISKAIDESTWGSSLFGLGLNAGSTYSIRLNPTAATPSKSDDVALLFHFPNGRRSLEVFQTSHGAFDVYTKALVLGEKQEPTSLHLAGPRTFPSDDTGLCSGGHLSKGLDDSTWAFSLAELGLTAGRAYDLTICWDKETEASGRQVLVAAMDVPPAHVYPVLAVQALNQATDFSTVHGKVEKFEIC